MLSILSFDLLDNKFSIFFWIVLFIVVTLLFIYFMHSSYAYFNKREVRVHFKRGNEERVKTLKVKIGKIVIPSQLDTFKDVDISEYDIMLIKSDSEIEEGNFESFKMPSNDVDIYYEFRENDEEEALEERRKRYYLNLPRSVKDLEEKVAVPVVLITLDDLKEHLRNTNKSYLFPLNNNFQIGCKEPYEVLVSYVSDIAYAVVSYSEVTFKLFFRSDAQYVQDKLSHIASLSHVDKDIYSLVVDSSFASYVEVMNVFDHSYHYTLDMAFDRRNAITYKLQVNTELYNSQLLQIVDDLPKEFDPVFEKAQQDARRYREYLDMLKNKEQNLDKPLEPSKDKLYKILEDIEEYIAPMHKDEYEKALTFEGEILQLEPGIRDKGIGEEETIKDIADEIIDLYATGPSTLVPDNVVDYIVSRNEMPNLTMDIGEFDEEDEQYNEPTTLKYLSSYFAILYMKKKKFRISMRQDSYVVKELVKTHPNIVNVRNGNEEDWYTLLIDDTYDSYQELYSIFLSSYNYTKAEHYKKSKTDKENNLLK